MEYVWHWKTAFHLKVAVWASVHETWIQTSLWAALPSINGLLVCCRSSIRPPRSTTPYVILFHMSTAEIIVPENIALNRRKGTLHSLPHFKMSRPLFFFPSALFSFSLIASIAWFYMKFSFRPASQPICWCSPIN